MSQGSAPRQADLFRDTIEICARWSARTRSSDRGSRDLCGGASLKWGHERALDGTTTRHRGLTAANLRRGTCNSTCLPKACEAGVRVPDQLRGQSTANSHRIYL